MSLESELAIFVQSRPAFWTPICSAFSVSLPTPPASISDPKILARLCYGNAPQNANAGPYLVWTGPFDYDPGLFSGGALDNRTAKFWFTCYAQYLDTAADWMTAVEDDIRTLFVPGYFFPATTIRIMSMLLQKGSKMSASSDQTFRTGQEFPLNGFTCAYQICWQTK